MFSNERLPRFTGRAASYFGVLLCGLAVFSFSTQTLGQTTPARSAAGQVRTAPPRFTPSQADLNPATRRPVATCALAVCFADYNNGQNPATPIDHNRDARLLPPRPAAPNTGPMGEDPSVFNICRLDGADLYYKNALELPKVTPLRTASGSKATEGSSCDNCKLSGSMPGGLDNVASEVRGLQEFQSEMLRESTTSPDESTTTSPDESTTTSPEVSTAASPDELVTTKLAKSTGPSTAESTTPRISRECIARSLQRSNVFRNTLTRCASPNSRRMPARPPPQCPTNKLVDFLHTWSNAALSCLDPAGSKSNGKDHLKLDPEFVFSLINHESACQLHETGAVTSGGVHIPGGFMID